MIFNHVFQFKGEIFINKLLKNITFKEVKLDLKKYLK